MIKGILDISQKLQPNKENAKLDYGSWHFCIIFILVPLVGNAFLAYEIVMNYCKVRCWKGNESVTLKLMKLEVWNNSKSSLNNGDQ